MATNGNKDNNKDRKSGSVISPDELKGYFYVYGDTDQSDRYLRTTRRIADYVAQRFTKQIGALVEKGEEAAFEEPIDPEKDASRTAEKHFEMELKMTMEREEKYKQDKAKVFRIILGQC